MQTSLLEAIFFVVSHKSVSDEALRCLIVTIKAQDSLLTGSSDNLPKEEFHRFLLLLPYLMS